MCMLGYPEIEILLLFALIVTISNFVLYIVIRRAVRDGIADASKKKMRPPKAYRDETI